MSASRANGTPSQGLPASGQPSTFDTLIQSSAVGLFHAYGVAAAPLTPVTTSFEHLRPHYPVAVISFRSQGMDAALILSIPPGVCSELKLDGVRTHTHRDLVRELANQAMGRIKNRLTQYQVTLQCGLPTSVDRARDLELLAPQRGPLTSFGFRTVHQNILLAIKGTVDTSFLVYASATRINGEGAILVFDDALNRSEGDRK
jgi:hypothetical protein